MNYEIIISFFHNSVAENSGLLGRHAVLLGEWLHSFTGMSRHATTWCQIPEDLNPELLTI
jgi:hypothetical protein